MNKQAFHNYPKRLEWAIRALDRSGISRRNKELILEFRQDCVLEGIGQPRMIRYLGVLKDFAGWLNVDFDQVEEPDIKRAVRLLEERPAYSPWTRATYKSMLKRFYKWLRKSHDMPPEVRWIGTRIKRSERRLPSESELLTEMDIETLIATADHARDHALVATLWESGARIGEIGSLTIGRVEFDEHGAVLHVTGKTGPRPVRIISATAHLAAWINVHPYREDPKAPLWILIGTTRHHQPMPYTAMRKMLSNLAKKAGLKKRCNPHFFRHSRATYLANHLTEFQMNQYLGWVQGSDMPSTYVHMSGKNLDASILKLNGREQSERLTVSRLAPRSCGRCKTQNASDSRYCTACGGALDVASALALDHAATRSRQDRATADQIMNVLMQDADFRRILTSKAADLGLLQ